MLSFTLLLSVLWIGVLLEEILHVTAMLNDDFSKLFVIQSTAFTSIFHIGRLLVCSMAEALFIAWIVKK